MDAADFLQIAADWSHWDAPPPASVPRSLRLPAELRSDIALVVQGVRRAGKSTLLRQLIGRYGLDRQRCLFVNFEDPRLAPALDHTTLDVMVEAFEADRGPDCRSVGRRRRTVRDGRSTGSTPRTPPRPRPCS